MPDRTNRPWALFQSGTLAFVLDLGYLAAIFVVPLTVGAIEVLHRVLEFFGCCTGTQ